MSGYAIYALVLTFILICYYIGMISYDLFFTGKFVKPEDTIETIIPATGTKKEGDPEEPSNTKVVNESGDGFVIHGEELEPNQVVEEDDEVVEGKPITEEENSTEATVVTEKAESTPSTEATIKDKFFKIQQRAQPVIPQISGARTATELGYAPSYEE